MIVVDGGWVWIEASGRFMSGFRKVGVALWSMAVIGIIVLGFVDVDAEVRRQYSNIVQLGAAYACALLCFGTARAFTVADPLRQVWTLIGLGTFAWAMGQSYFWLYPTVNGGAETPYPSLADAGFLLIGPLFVVALIRFRYAAGLHAPPFGVVAAILLLVLSGIITGAYNWEGIKSADPALRSVSIAYALSDPVMLAVTAWVAFGFGRGRIARSWWYVVLGVAAFLGGNQAYSWMQSQGIYVSGAMTDALWPIGFGLIALGAVMSRAAYRDLIADA